MGGEAPPRSPGEYVTWAVDQHVGCGMFQYVYVLALCWTYGVVCVQTFANMFATERVAWHAACPSGSCPVLAEPENCTVPLEEWRADEPGLSLLGDLKLVCERHRLVPMLGSLFFMGFAVGVTIAGVLSDRYGRRIAYFASYACLAVGGFLAPVAPSFFWYAVARVLVGAGVASSGLVAYIWATEFLATTSRGVMSWLPNVTFSIGQMLLSPLAYTVPHWRPFLLGCQGLVLTGMLYSCCLRESPQWLAVVGRQEEAYSVLCSMAAKNGRSPPPPQDEAPADDEFSDREEPRAEARGFLSEMCDPRLRFRFAVMCFNWFSISLAFYGLTMFSPNLPFSVYVGNVISGLVAVPFYLVAPVLIDAKWCGRRGAISGSYFVGSGCLVASTAISNETLSMAVYYIGNGALSLAFAVLYVWAAELFPTTIRARSMSVQSVFARLGAMSSPFVVDLGQTHPALALLIFATPCAICGALDLCLPETRARKLPHTTDDILSDDGESESPSAFSDGDDGK